MYIYIVLYSTHITLSCHTNTSSHFDGCAMCDVCRWCCYTIDRQATAAARNPPHTYTQLQVHIYDRIYGWVEQVLQCLKVEPIRGVLHLVISGGVHVVYVYIYIVWCRWRVECMWYLVCDICLMMFVSVLNSFSLSMCQTQRHLYIQI